MSMQPQFSKYSLAPTLLYTRTSSKPTKENIYYKIGNDVLTDFTRQCGQEYVERLKGIITEIFNPDIPFEPTDDKEACKNCDFAPLCGKD